MLRDKINKLTVVKVACFEQQLRTGFKLHVTYANFNFFDKTLNCKLILQPE